MDRKMDTLPIRSVLVTGGFWKHYVDLVREKMIPYQWEVLNDRVEGAAKSHCIENFRIAAGLSEGEYYGMVFQDSDLAKWMEAASLSLASKEDPALLSQLEEAVSLLKKAQGEDGYLDTYYTINEPEGRWGNLREGHELYVAGHLIEAACAYTQATGNGDFLKIACSLADCIGKVFGPRPDQVRGCPGHPEIELALVKLYRLTGRKEYLEQAKFFLDIRGTEPSIFDEEQKKSGFHHIFPEFGHLGYNNIQAHLPVRQQKKADGHAVRALYLYSAMADVAYETGDEELLEACRILYENITTRQMFVTGSVGSAADGECFTCDYDLPNNYNYSETCASVALAMFTARMAHIEKNGKYMDIAEQALYNTVLSGMSLSGTEFFYVNPLEVIPEQLRANRTLHHVLPQRRKWMGVACCPPNIARTVMGLGSYLFGQDEDTVFVNLYASCEAAAAVHGCEVKINMETDYPYDGRVFIRCINKGKTAENLKAGTKQDTGGDPAAEITLRLAFREPGWSSGIGKVTDDKGRELSVTHKNGYAYVELDLKEGLESTLQFEIPMQVQLLCSHPKAAENQGKTAIRRGPLIYCLEEADNGKDLGSLYLDPEAEPRVKFEQELLGGIPVIRMRAFRLLENGWEGKLYRPYSEASRETACEETEVTAVPYCMWNNRGTGEMRVWIRIRQ